MPKVLITGMSGTGKSAALQILGERGNHIVDTDTGQWSHWVRLFVGVMATRLSGPVRRAWEVVHPGGSHIGSQRRHCSRPWQVGRSWTVPLDRVTRAI